MNTILLENINQKLKFATDEILLKILNYTENLIEKSNIKNENDFILTQNQKQILENQNDVNLKECLEVNDDYFKNLKNKYEL